MGLFNIFSREKKENLDKGLQKTKTNLFARISKAVVGKSKVDNEVLDNLEEILVSSDVGVETTVRIIERIENRAARDKYLGTGELNTLLKEEIASLLQENNVVDFRPNQWLVFRNRHYGLHYFQLIRRFCLLYAGKDVVFGDISHEAVV